MKTDSLLKNSLAMTDCPKLPCGGPFVIPTIVPPPTKGNGTSINAGVNNIYINNFGFGEFNSCDDDEPCKPKPNCDASKFQVYDPAMEKCICPKNSIMTSEGDCVCHTGFEMTIDGVCVDRCPKVSETWNNALKKCEPICPGDQLFNTGSQKCECRDGKVWNDFEKVCNCPLGKKKNEIGICVDLCTEDKEFKIINNEPKCIPRCEEPMMWNEALFKCSCGLGLIFNAATKSCTCAAGSELKEGHCIPICEEGYIFKVDKCEPMCDKNKGAAYCIVSKECKCLEDDLVYNKATEACEIPNQTDPCPDPREVLDADTGLCVCDKAQHFSFTEKGCDCLQPYKPNEDESGCVYDPECPIGEEWSTVNEECTPLCKEGEIFDPETKKCGPKTCDDPEQEKVDPETGNCVPRCPEEGKKWCAVCKTCIDACNKDQGYVWDPETKKCVKSCPAPKNYYNPETKACECPDSKTYNPDTNKCESKCTNDQVFSYCYKAGTCIDACPRGFKMVNNKCTVITTLPTTQLVNDVTENIGYSEKCSWRGFYILGTCYCANWFEGDKCEKNKPIQVGALIGRNTLMPILLSLSFSIYPGYYPNGDDPLFPRIQYSIGFGNAFRGAMGNSWIQLTSLVNQQFQIFEANGQINILDIKQGSYGNCYMVAALGAMVSVRNACLIRDAFLNPVVNGSNIYCVRWFIHGRPHVLCVDTWVPANNGKPTGIPPNGRDTFWAQILEKTWSKTMSQYQATHGGHDSESLTGITGVTSEYYNHKRGDLQEMYNYICNAFKAGSPVTMSVSRGVLDGGHVYGLAGCYTVNLRGKNVNLLKHFNPYNQGSRWKTNPWGDGSANLNAVKDQIPDFIGDEFDGLVYQEMGDFRNNFGTVLISYSQPGFRPYINEILFDQNTNMGRFTTYTFKLTVLQPQVGKRFIIYIAHEYPRYTNTKDLSGWHSNGITVTGPTGETYKSYVTNSGSWSYDKFHQVHVPIAVAGVYTVQASVKQNLPFASFPCVIYGANNGIDVDQSKKPEWDPRHQIKDCPQKCASGICDYTSGTCFSHSSGGNSGGGGFLGGLFKLFG